MKTILLKTGEAAIVDDCDYDELSKYQWYLNTGYAVRSWWDDGRSRTMLMHRHILSAKKNQLVDHANMNRLDNRRKNIRFATKAQNGINRKKSKNCLSRYRGVTKTERSRCGEWQAQVRAKSKGVSMHLGFFDNEDDAAMAVDIVYKHLYGDFYNPNIPGGLHLSGFSS